MFLLFLSTIVSCVALLVFLALAKNRGGLAGILGLSVVGFFASPLFSSAALALHMLATFVVALICIPLVEHRRLVAALLIAAPLLAYWLIVPGIFNRLQALHELRQQFPVESLAARLKYEHQHREAASSATDCGASAPELAPDVEHELASAEKLREQAVWASYRLQSLERLHNRTQDDFILATGFGPVRMIGLASREAIELPSPEPVPVEVSPSQLPPAPSDISASDELAAAAPAARTAPHEAVLQQMHREGSNDLFDWGRMGYVQDVAHVAGFQSHRFSKIPGADTVPWRQEWKLARLELIGLLKYDQPRAYVSEFLPRLDELGEKATRNLDAFETAALEQLRTERDVVIDETADRIRMAGSLRAGKDCLQCHDVKRGELIGVLSYDLVPARTGQLSQNGAAPQNFAAP